MNKNGDIIIIEDDVDDRFIIDIILTEILEERNYTNTILFLNDGDEALTYLKNMQTVPFIIISDINLPKINGMELREHIFQDPEIKEKCIPYIFLSTTRNPALIRESYQLSIQGFFEKPYDHEDYRILLTEIISYWKRALSPIHLRL